MSRPLVSAGRDHTGDERMDRLWRAVREIERQVNASPMTRGRLITEEPDAIEGSGLVFTSAVVRAIPHALGRKVRGFIEVYGPDTPSAGVVGLRPVAHIANVTSDTHVTVRPTATGTCFLWVF